jgi:hypothetical protein
MRNVDCRARFQTHCSHHPSLLVTCWPRLCSPPPFWLSAAFGPKMSTSRSWQKLVSITHLAIPQNTHAYACSGKVCKRDLNCQAQPPTVHLCSPLSPVGHVPAARRCLAECRIWPQDVSQQTLTEARERKGICQPRQLPMHGHLQCPAPSNPVGHDSRPTDTIICASFMY